MIFLLESIDCSPGYMVRECSLEEAEQAINSALKVNPDYKYKIISGDYLKVETITTEIRISR